MGKIHFYTDSTRPQKDAEVSIKQTLSRFQSFGDNCELGVAQRYCGIEPRGLFRFSTSAIQQLIDALDDDFSSYGAKDDLEIVPGPGNYYWCKSRRYDFGRSTNETIGMVDPAELLAREYEKVAYLKQCLLGELAEGHKIFVRKGRPSEKLDEFLSLASAIRRHGSSAVLRVEAAPSPALIGGVEWMSPGIMRGYVRRFSPYEGGMEIELEPWVEVCRNAYALAANIPRRPEPDYSEFFPIRAARKIVKHMTRHRENGLSSFAAAVDQGKLALGSINVFSAWVWIPRDFRGNQIFGFVKFAGTYQRLAKRDADLSIRDSWQRMWISVQIPQRLPKLVLGLAAVAEGAQRFWSTDWRISEDPFPPPAPLPSIAIPKSIKERLFG